MHACSPSWSAHAARWVPGVVCACVCVHARQPWGWLEQCKASGGGLAWERHGALAGGRPSMHQQQYLQQPGSSINSTRLTTSSFPCPDAPLPLCTEVQVRREAG